MNCGVYVCMYWIHTIYIFIHTYVQLLKTTADSNPVFAFQTHAYEFEMLSVLLAYHNPILLETIFSAF